MIRTNKGITAGACIVALSSLAVGAVSGWSVSAVMWWGVGAVIVIFADIVVGIVSTRELLKPADKRNQWHSWPWTADGKVSKARIKETEGPVKEEELSTLIIAAQKAELMNKELKFEKAVKEIAESEERQCPIGSRGYGRSGSFDGKCFSYTWTEDGTLTAQVTMGNIALYVWKGHTAHIHSYITAFRYGEWMKRALVHATKLREDREALEKLRAAKAKKQQLEGFESWPD